MMRYLGRVLGIALFVAVVWSSSANAVTAWFTCEVTAAGNSSDGTLWVQLTDVSGAFTTKWFIGTSAIEKEMLATALTAMTADMQVLVNTDPDDGTFPLLNNLYLLK